MVSLEKEGRLVLYLERRDETGSLFHYHVVYNSDYEESRGFGLLTEPGDYLTPKSIGDGDMRPREREEPLVLIDESEGHRYWLLCASEDGKRVHLCNWVERSTKLFLLRNDSVRQVLHAEFSIGNYNDGKRIYRHVYRENGEVIGINMG